jgi:hypothetical protein
VDGEPHCECAPGYSGVLCERNTDDCADEPCQNGGHCVDGLDSYQCMCAPGFEGPACGAETDECEGVPCEHDGVCTDQVNGFECDCAPGYAGPTCSENIDDCADTPCANDGLCVDGVQSFVCECKPGFEGTSCDVNIDDCVEVVCENGGTCVDEPNGYHCNCINGYEGTYCEIDPVWLLPPGFSQVHFEDLPVDEEGQTSSLSMTLPEHSLSFTVLTSAAGADEYTGLIKLVHSKAILVKGYSSVLCVVCANRVYASVDVATALVPNSPEVTYKSQGSYSLAAAQHTVTVYEGAVYKIPVIDTPMDVRVLIKQWEGEPTKGILNLNLWFTEGTGVVAADAMSHPDIIAMLERLNELLAQTGISVGTVTPLDLPVDVPQSVTTTLGTDSDLGLLFQATAGAPSGVNVMFVESIVKENLEDGNTGIVLGIAGGIPGPPFVVDGSSHSGVAISWTDTGGNPDLLAATIAHELGHYLGLFHTTEQAKEGDPPGGSHDPIGDTEENDKTNLMWWASEGGAVLTEGQGFVLLRHPNVWLQSASEGDEP